MEASWFPPVLAVAVILVFQYHSAAGDFALPPLSENPCTLSICGKGSCVAVKNSTFGFECQCESGWRQTRSDDDYNLKFLPCVIPDCTMKNSCAYAPAPRRNQTRPTLLPTDPCYWADCGGGSCNSSSPLTHTCICYDGYYNLLNSTAFPCYQECAVGVECAKLGITLPKSSSSPIPSRSSGDNNANHGETEAEHSELIFYPVKQFL